MKDVFVWHLEITDSFLLVLLVGNIDCSARHAYVCMCQSSAKCNNAAACA